MYDILTKGSNLLTKPKEQAKTSTGKKEATSTTTKSTDKDIKSMIDQLDKIFGIPKTLTKEEQKKADEIEQKITKIYDKLLGEATSFTDENAAFKEANAKVEVLNKELDKLYGVKSYDDLTKEEKKTVDGINEKLIKAAEASLNATEFMMGDAMGSVDLGNFDGLLQMDNMEFNQTDFFSGQTGITDIATSGQMNATDFGLSGQMSMADFGTNGQVNMTDIGLIGQGSSMGADGFFSLG